MNENAFEVMGLDKDFNLVSLLRYSNLQWRRKFYEAGSFSIQIPLEQYDPAIKFIYSKDRPEVGEICQVNYMDKDGRRTFALSGYFLENQLNRRVAYPHATSNIVNSPSWIELGDTAEDVATYFFDDFKDVTVSKNGTKTCELGIATAASSHRGKYSEHTRNGEYLGNKIHEILKPSEMSYVIEYDYINNTKTFHCVKGQDLTQENALENNPVVFSTRYGNLKNPNILWSEENYKNAYIATNEYTEDDIKYLYSQSDVEKLDTDLYVDFLYVSSSVNKSDYETETAYLSAIANDGHTELLKSIRTISFDFDSIEGSYRYRQDFDLGDKCSLEVKEIGLSVDAVLTACTEVIKQGSWTLSLEFDV